MTLKSCLHIYREILNKTKMVARQNKITPVTGQSRIDCPRLSNCFTVEQISNGSSILPSSVNAKALKRHQLGTLSDQRNIRNFTSHDRNEIAQSNELQTIQPVAEKNKLTRHFIPKKCCALSNCICSTTQTRKWPIT